MKTAAFYIVSFTVLALIWAGIVITIQTITVSPDYLLASMASKPKPWKSVEVVYTDDAVSECSLLDSVAVRAVYGNFSESATKRAEETALKRLRIATNKAGGDTVLVLRMESGEGRAHVWGEAYRCEEK